MQNYNFEKLEEWSEILKCMAHPVRLCILRGLYTEGENNVSRMQECLKIPQSTVSQHVAILRNKGVIKGKRNGLEISYSISNGLAKEIIKTLLNTMEL